MKRMISERHIVVVLFVVVFITFSFAHEDSKDFEQIYTGFKPLPAAEFTASQSSNAAVIEKQDNKKNRPDDLNLR